jgi:muramoyltetrapeptide carboxypeptidase
MTIPPFLRPGDTIAIIATARKISENELKKATDVFEQAGLKVEFGNNLFKSENQFSGSDEERAEDLQWALDDDEIKAVVIARGGYGTIRIIDKIDFNLFQKKPKWIVGYSDVTVLHSHIHSHFKIPTLHATMPINFLKNEESIKTLLNSLFGITTNYTCNAHVLNKIGNANSVLIGGNLSILYALSSSASDINTNGKILFIEDLDEYLYHIDRMLYAFEKAGVFKKIKGLIVGGMTDLQDTDIPFGQTIEEIILHHFTYRKIPVAFNFPAGHIDDNKALILGSECELIVTDLHSTLNFL